MKFLLDGTFSAPINLHKHKILSEEEEEGKSKAVIPATVCSGKYSVIAKIGTGSFGVVYTGIDNETGEEIALKFEDLDSKTQQLVMESKVYKSLENTAVIPKFHWLGSSTNHLVLVIDLMGKNLYQLMKICGGKFSLQTTLLLAYRMLQCVEALHKYGFVHRDIKPENFLLGKKEEDKDKIFIIDFGLTKKYVDVSGAHIGYIDGQPFVGNPRFASINSLKGIEQSRRDDIESLLYVWIYFAKGTLPWISLGNSSKKPNSQRILECKQKINTSELFKDLPKEFLRIYFSVKQLRFPDMPNYKLIGSLLSAAFKRICPTKNIDDPPDYDWAGKI